MDAPTLLGGSIRAIRTDAALAAPGQPAPVAAESTRTAEASPREALLEALEVRRYARLALGVGAAVAVGVTLLFVGGLAGGRTDEPLWIYPSLAFVVFVTSALLAAAVLVGRQALRLAVHPAAIVRRSATGGLVAGGLWLVGAAGLALGPGGPWSAVADLALPWAALLTPLGFWAVYTRFKRTARFRIGLTAATLVGLAAVLVLADVAAFEFVALLPDVGDGVTPRLVDLFGLAAAGLVGAQAVVAALALLGGEGASGPALVLALPALLGLFTYQLLAPGRLALAALAAGLAVAWIGTCWGLRGVPDADVPAGPDPWPEGT